MNLKINFKKIAAILAVSSIALSKAPIGAYALAYDNPDTVKTTTAVNLRIDDDKESDLICTLAPETEITRILESTSDWDLVIYKDNIGYVYNQYIQDLDPSNNIYHTTKLDGTITADTNVRLRLGPSTDDSKIDLILEGDKAEVLGISDNNWYLVRYNNKIGYVSGWNVTYKKSVDKQVTEEPIEAKEITLYTTTDVNFRTEPFIGDNKIELLDKNTKVTFIRSTSKDWTEVNYNGTIGYINNKYLSFNPINGYRTQLKVVYATTVLELKEQPNNKSNSLYKIDKYETVEVLEESDNWYLVRAANKIGYVYRENTHKLTDIFVVVDISAQKLTLYNGNTIILETDIVTGKKGVSDTPTGLYSINYKTKDTYLKGPGYNSHVDYWMPFNGGIGLHDADWRSKFGGTIYDGSGSHGCVNIPPEYADDIYSEVSKGTKVLVQK